MKVIARSSSVLVVVLSILQSTLSFAAGNYPIAPHPQLTPGALCTSPTAYRYPEQIPYCDRAVGSALKQRVIDVYVERFGYNITASNRSAFKIDHYIPLCMGGSNEATNLWPQHESVYKVTDSLEQLSCIKMANGRLRQADAIQLIKRVKNNLSQAADAVQYLNSL